jgi:hypothetical protein
MNATQAEDKNIDVSVGLTDVKSLYERAEKAFNEVNQWQGIWQRIMQHVSPESNNYYNASGTTKRTNIYDNTAIYYTNMYISQFISNIFPPQNRWASLVPSYGMVHAYMRRNGLNVGGDNIFENAREHLRMGCDLLSRQIFDLIIDSNFDGVLPKAVISYMIAGGALHVSPDVYRGHGVSFFVPPLGSYAYDVDGFGNVYGVFYATRMNLQNARLQWDLKDLPSTFNGKSVVNIVECTVKEGAMWKYVVLMSPGSSSGGANGVTLATAPKYFGVNPWTLIRPGTARSEIWGRGKLAECYQDLERINQETYNRIINQEMATQNAFLYKDDGSINPHTFRIGPGALIKVKSTGGPNGASLVPLQLPYNLEAVGRSRDESIDNIRKLTLGDPLLNGDRNTYQSATEWVDRQKRNQLMWGKDFGKILPAAKNILLGVCEIGLANGSIGWPSQLSDFQNPQELEMFGIKLESPVSKMYNSQEVESLVAITQITQSLSPQLVEMAIRMEDIPRWLSEMLGVDPKLFHTAEEIAVEKGNISDAMKRMTNPSDAVTPYHGKGI